MKSTTLSACGTVLFCLLSTSSISQFGGGGKDWNVVEANTSDALTGLKGVFLIVTGPDEKDAAYADGLHEDDIRTDVELMLRQSGIPILSADAYATKGPPTRKELIKRMASMSMLDVIVDTTKRGETYSYRVQVTLKESVVLERMPSTLVAGATTWEDGSSGIAGSGRVSEIRNDVKDAIGGFCNKYLKANPRPAAQTPPQPQPGDLLPSHP